MAGQTQGGEKLANQIACIKYTIFCFNIVAWLIGAGLFGLTVWIRAEPDFEEWVGLLHIHEYYIGVYILIILSIVVMIVSFLGCGSALMEQTLALTAFIITQIVTFVIGVVGAALLLMYSTRDSLIHPMLERTFGRLIMTSEHEPSRGILKMVQEKVGCCGAEGPNDYMLLRQPLPLECRDTISGQAFQNGCVRELIWYLEDKSAWAAGLAMAIVLIATVNCVLSIVLIQALRKEEEEARIYRQ